MTVQKLWLPPRWLARGLERLRSGLSRLQRHSTLPPLAMLEITMGAWLSQAVYAAAKLGVADALARGPRSPQDLAGELHVDADALRRLLRALSQYGVFRALRDGRYAQTALSETLRVDVPGSVRGFVLFQGHPKHRMHWSALAETVRDGHSDMQQRYGRTLFEELAHDRELGAVFDDAMTSLSRLDGEATLASYDFTRFRAIVDVGGGRGAKLAAILRSAPRASGVLFDLPEVTAHAQPLRQEHGARVRIESGSFFERVPEGGDAYVLKNILHDWSDAHALTILRNVRRAIQPEGRLLLIEGVVPEGPEPHLSKLVDLEMLIIDGKERTQREFERLFAGTGFALERIVPTAGPSSVLEARPVSLQRQPPPRAW